MAYKAVAGVLALVAAGFLIAALWTLLARNFGWGPLWASVAVAVLFGVGAAIFLARSKTVEHPVPSTDDLKREVEARASLAAEAGMERAKEKAREVVDHAENKVHGLIDTVSFKAAEIVESAEAKVQRFTSGTVAQATSKLGLDGGPAEQLLEKVGEVSRSRAGPAIGLVGALILGMALASRLGARDDDWDEDESEDWDEDVHA